MASQTGSDRNNGSFDGFTNSNEGSESHDQQKLYRQQTPKKLERLEGFFKISQHPNQKQQLQLAKELGLEPQQIKLWFQNKRAQSKVQIERIENKYLRSEIERIQLFKNIVMKKAAVKNTKCSSSCSCEDDEKPTHRNSVEESFKQMIEASTTMQTTTTTAAKYKGKGVATKQRSKLPEVGESSNNNRNNESSKCLKNEELQESQKLTLAKMAATAVDELTTLIMVDQPLWNNYNCFDNHHYALNREAYNKEFSSSSKPRFSRSRIEGSKYSAIVPMNARFLVELYLNPEKWVNRFPTIFSDAKIVKVLEPGLPENRSGSLQLVYEQMLTLSILTRDRYYNLIQHCLQLEEGVWVIVIFSYYCCDNCFRDSLTRCWKYSSGYMIRELPDGSSKVICVEHVEVDREIMFHPDSEHHLRSAMDFGAKRWVTTLENACQIRSYLRESIRSNDSAAKGKRNAILLGCGLMKNFCSIFHLFGGKDPPLQPKQGNEKIKMIFRQNKVNEAFVGSVVCVGSSFWVPATTDQVFKYLNDHSVRHQWDALCDQQPLEEVMSLPIGIYSKTNAISVMKPKVPQESLAVIFQESVLQPSGESIIVYAPVVTSKVFSVSTTGARTNPSIPNGPILASGFSITPGSKAAFPAFPPHYSSSSTTRGGTIINVAFQVRVDCKPSDVSDGTLDMVEEFASHAISFLEATFGKIF